MVDPYSWIQKEAYITASQEHFLDSIPGWNDAKLDESPGIPELSENSSFQLGCESSENDSRDNVSEQEPFKGFPVQQTVEIASPDDFEEEKLEESYNPAFESDRSQSPSPSESFSLPIVELPDIPSAPYNTQIGMGLSSRETPECYNEAGFQVLEINDQSDPLATISGLKQEIVSTPPLKLSVAKLDSKVLLCKVEAGEAEARGYGKRRKRRCSKMQSSETSKLHLSDNQEGESLSFSFTDASLKHLGNYIEQIDAVKHNMDLQGKSSLSAPASPPSKREGESLSFSFADASLKHLGNYIEQIDAVKHNIDLLGKSYLSAPASPPSKRIEEKGPSFVTSPGSFVLRKEARDSRGSLFQSKSSNNVCRMLHSEEVQCEQFSFHEPMKGIYDASSAELVSSVGTKTIERPHSSKKHGHKAVLTFKENENKHSCLNTGDVSEHIPATNQAICKKDHTSGNALVFQFPISGEAFTEEMEAKVRDRDRSMYPESVMDVVMHHSGSLPPLSSITDFKSIAMKSGLSLPPPFGHSHNCIKK